MGDDIVVDKMLKVKRGLFVFTAVAITAMPLLVARPAAAASANLYLSPSSSSVTIGSTFSVNIRENSGSDAVNAAEIHLTYPADKLDYVSTTSSSAFGIVAANSGGAGKVSVDRGAIPAVSGDQLVATVRFKAKVSSGSASISISSSSKVVSAANSQNILTSTKGATRTFRAASSSTPAQAPTPADTIAPTIDKAPSATDATLKTAVISWTTSEPSTSEVVYGLSTGYGLAATDPALVTDHKITLSSAILAPGNIYHYMVKSVDSAGNAVSSADATFSTKGYALDVTVVNQKGKPVSGAKVTIDEKSGVTSKDGKVTINDLPLGKLAGTVEHKGKKTTVSVTVEEPKEEGKNQTATLGIETATNTWLLVLLILGLLALAALAARRIIKRRRSGGPPAAGPTKGTPASPASPTVIGPSAKP